MRVSTMENSFLDTEKLQKDWDTNGRWKGISRNYKSNEVIVKRNSVEIKHTLSQNGAQPVSYTHLKLTTKRIV